MAYDTSQRPGESLDQWYSRLAKTADQRLVRLEKLSEQEGFKTADKWAYQSAMTDLEQWNFGRVTEHMRFNRNKPVDETQLKMKIADMRNFIDAPTSTKQGILTSYKNRVKTFNEGRYGEQGQLIKGKYDTSFTWETLAIYYQRGIAAKVSKFYGSKTALKAIGKIQKLAENKKKELGSGASNRDIITALREEIKAKGQQDWVVSDDLIDEKVRKIINNRGLAIERIFED